MARTHRTRFVAEDPETGFPEWAVLSRHRGHRRERVKNRPIAALDAKNRARNRRWHREHVRELG